MFAASKSGSAVEATDAQFNYVTMLLHGDGTNGAQNNTFLDSSTNNFTITRNGNTTQGTFTPYGSNWSNYFDGSGDTVAAASNTSLIFGTGDFTVECWINSGSQPGAYNTIIGSDATGSFLLSITGSGTSTAVYINAYGSGAIYNQSYTVTQGTWFHLAATRSGTSLRVFVNGTQLGSTVTDSTNFSAATRMIGGAGTSSQNFSGYVSNARIVKGTAVYTSNFTPSTTPLTAITNTSLLTCADNRFIDDSTNAYALTVTGNTSVQRFSPFSPTTAYSTSVIGGSGYFDGSGDYLDAGTNAALGFGTGDFTVEAWIYRTASSSGTFPIYTNGPTSSGSFAFYIVSDVVRVDYYGGSTLSGATTVSLNTWNHVAVIRSGSTLSVYLNGVRDGTTTTSSNNTTSNGMVGRDWTNSTAYSTGYISNARVVKGTAVYSGTTYTVPTAPLTAVTNTSLLLSYTNAGILDNAMMNDLETVGNAQISTSVKKYGTGSMAFDGTGDYLFRPNSPLYDFGTGDFTLEMWVYRNGSQTAYAGLVSFSVNNGNGLILGFGNADNKLRVVWNNAQTILASTAMTNTTWTHVALVRYGATVTCYQDGTSVGTSNISTSAMPFTGDGMVIGRLVTDTDNYYFNGYIDDFRITKGVARYTANFTAPTTAFADKG